jgi:hypothetical protein
MKKTFHLITVIFALGVLTWAAQAADYRYRTSNGAITITGYTGPDGDLAIPNAIDGLPVTSIEVSGFWGCTSLTSITIPDSVISIGGTWAGEELVFDWCPNLRAITVDGSNPNYTSVDGVLFNKATTTLIQCPQGKAGTYAIPNSVTYVGDLAFIRCTDLTSVTIPNSVTSIGWKAFAACTSLTTVTIPNSVTSIGVEAFYGCTSLTNITIPNSVTSIGQIAFRGCGLTSVTIPSSVTGIGYWTFDGCTRLTSVTIPNSVTEIGDSAFFGCTSLTNITIPNSVTSIWDWAFYGCSSLTSITIGHGLASIGYGWLDGCTSLTAIIVDASNDNYSSLDGVLFDKNQTTLIQCPARKAGNFTIPNSVITIASYSFSSCSNLTSITIPSGVTSVGRAAFQDCTSLTDVALPGSVTNLGPNSFAGCSNLRSVVIPVGVTTIEQGTFSGCTNLTSVVIPDSVVTIRNSRHSGPAGPDWFWGSGAFEGCTGLTNVSFRASVLEIGPHSFENCSSLRDVVIPVGATTIEEGAFSGCTSLTSIVIPDSVVTIINRLHRSILGDYWGSGAFAGCTSLTNVSMGEHLTELGANAFKGCSNLRDVIIPAGIVVMQEGAFSGCTSLAGVHFEGDCPGLAWENQAYWASPFDGSDNVTINYLPGTLGWDTNYAGRPTALWVLPYPVILNRSPSFGTQTNGFGFTVSWATNVPVVVEASASLNNPAWTALVTNTLVNGTSYFSDADWTNHPARFYRVRAQ